MLHSLLVRYIYKIVPEPYMDEIFHVDQTRRYCSHNFTWNPKITTPPALYVISVPLFCGHERYANSALIPFAFVGCCQFRRLFQKNSESSLLVSLAVLLLPVLFHSSLLYYTDLLSLTTVLWALSQPPGLFPTLIFALSLCTRQTNIIWAAAYGCVHFFLLLKNEGKFTAKAVISSLLRLWSLLLLPIAFIVFYVLNDRSIVLGDHSAHRPVPHFMQIHYFFVFFIFSAAPLLGSNLKTFQSLGRLVFSPRKNFISTVLLIFCVFFFTMQHPYLLADNRHFTFYIWRRWFLRHPLCRYLTVPLYIVSLQLFRYTVSHWPRFLVLLYILGTVAVVVPVHLVEPRYFITSYVIWRLSYVDRPLTVLLLELLYEAIVNVFVLYLFLAKPFEWPHEPGVKQRFMW
ncbi:unnamed protein product [Gongylonema pulchrum]|uniref:Dol-P-Glc:Glc(2)Man(9)GlcNAc(2)-PP-Dol alpha-1,2-glucosyltransferase n=1 Tax=Gongylonema pulchrum TaxID=637853 RepID=A0A3P7Q6L8_9BILA|nr:unnamed protein product [Gongylonema pulchrum]